MFPLNQIRSSQVDDNSKTERQFDFWREAVLNKNDSASVVSGSISYKYFYSFSTSQLPDLLSLEIPVLVTYGTKDKNSLLNDYLRIEAIKQGKDNFTFKEYLGTEHNYYPR